MSLSLGLIVVFVLILLIIINIITPLLVGILHFFGTLISSLFENKHKTGGKK